MTAAIWPCFASTATPSSLRNTYTGTPSRCVASHHTVLAFRLARGTGFGCSFHFQRMRHSCPFLHCSVITADKQRIHGV
jgi:hypothetical protein